VPDPQSTIDLAHALGLQVVAEGVETEADRLALRDLGCDAIQGFLLTPALPVETLTEWLVGRGWEMRPGRAA
jgi:diguanylate cyclase